MKAAENKSLQQTVRGIWEGEDISGVSVDRFDPNHSESVGTDVGCWGGEENLRCPTGKAENFQNELSLGKKVLPKKKFYNG